MKHMILTTLAVISELPNDTEEGIIRKLTHRGISELQAELLLAFVPLGLGRVVINRLNVDNQLIFADFVHVRDWIRGCDHVVRLKNVIEYLEGVRLGEETFTTGIIPRNQMSAAVNFSAEFNAFNNALNAGISVKGGRMHPPILMRLSEVAGFENWLDGVLSEKIPY